MSTDIIWALDQRERCIACPAAPAANAVVLHLASDGSLAHDAVGTWAERGVMAAGVMWPGASAELTEDDWLDLEDAVAGLAGLARSVALHGEQGCSEIVTELGRRTETSLVEVENPDGLLRRLLEASPT